MNLLQFFIEFLLTQTNRPSLLTVKNYKADIRQFINWFEHTFNLSFDPSKISPQTLYDYLKERNLSKSSAKRHVSSLRKFFGFLITSGIISQNPLEKKNISAGDFAKADPWMITNFKSFLYEYNKSDLTIKNYINDVQGFIAWLKEVTLFNSDLGTENQKVFSLVTLPAIEEYKRRLILTKFSPATVNRKLSSLRQYVGWAKSQGLLANTQTSRSRQAEVDEVSNIKKELYAPLNISTANFPTYKKILHFMRHARPAWYKKYHSYSFTHYFHFAILTILSCTIGFGLYSNYFVNKPDDAVLGVSQESAIAPLADNALALEGFKLIISTSKDRDVILALDSSGNLSIPGDQAHIFQTPGGNFSLAGKALSLTTSPNSNGNIEIVPDGTGKINLVGPIQNSSNNNNLSSAVGSVEFDDTVAILATTSAQSALYINQNSTGKLISADTHETAKFTVGNDGSGMFAGNLEISGGSLTSAATTFNLLSSNVAILDIGGSTATLNLGNTSGDTAIRSNLILSLLQSKGGILYTNESGKVFQASSGSTSDCLTGGATPGFASCANILQQAQTVGIGTTDPLFRLDVRDMQDATAAAQIYNTSSSSTATGLIVKLGTASATLSSSNHFINFETNGIGIVGSIQGQENGTGVAFATSGTADFAEYLKKDHNQTIEYGSLICLNNAGLAAKCDYANSNIIGVASEHPAFLGGQNKGNNTIAVGLAGQVEAFVSAQNGQIKAGDALTISDIPGVGIKSTKAGRIIGTVLENLTADESKVAGYYDPDNKEYRSRANFPNIPLKPNIIRIYKISVLVNVSWHDPSVYLAQNGELVTPNPGSADYPVSGETFWDSVATNIKAKLINVSKAVTDTLVVTSDSIIVNGQNFRDYIAGVIDDLGIRPSGQGSEIISPIVRTDEISTNIISPLAQDSDISASLNDSHFVIRNSRNASSSAVVSIDNQGNASFSGTFNALAVKTNDASISGTLRAGNIIADSIQGLEDLLDIASYSAQLSNVPQINLYDLSIAGRISVGTTMFIAQNYIETLGSDLSLQSLRQGGLSIMGGLVYVDTQGNIKVQGDLSISGKLAVNTISPSSDLVINNINGSSVLSVSQMGDVRASGSGTFAKLNLSFIQPALAISPTEAIASSSAGSANITANQSEVTIRNDFVTEKSVIYITPVGTPSAQTPFLINQTPRKSFTVGIQSPTDHPLGFNWLIVN